MVDYDVMAGRNYTVVPTVESKLGMHHGRIDVFHTEKKLLIIWYKIIKRSIEKINRFLLIN